jgi:PAS domain S-box-containing protein
VVVDDAGAPGPRTPELAPLAEQGVRAALATPIIVSGSVLGVFEAHRADAGGWTQEEVELAEAVAREVGLAAQTASLLEQNELRLRQQAALLKAAQVVASELEPGTVLARLVEEVGRLVGADAADFYVLDAERGVFRCAAVRGLPEDVLGFEFPLDRGLAAEAVSRRRAVLAEDYTSTVDPVSHPAYEGFDHAMVAPVSWAGEPRGVLGVGNRGPDRAFAVDDLDVLETFAGLAAVALRNAEAFEDRSRQARVQRGFFRIASVLAEPLALAGTLDAVAQAASEAFGGTCAAVLMREDETLEPAGAYELPDAVARDLDAGGAARQRTLVETAESGRILAAPELGHDERFGPEWRRLIGEAGQRSLIVIPLQAGLEGDLSTGVVLVFFAEQRRFADDDVELAQHLAGAARGALERSSLYEEERRARTLAQQLARTGGLLATELDPGAVLDEVVRQAPGVLGVDACAIRVLEGDELVVSAVEGAGLGALLGARSPVAGRLGGDVAQSNAPLAVTDAGSDARMRAADPVLQAGYRAYLGVPLAGAEGAANGVLTVYARRPKRWRDEEVEALQALAANASAALANAELYQRVALANERSYAILANIADGIVALNRDGNVVLWNAAAEQITGVPADEALGRTPAEVLGRTLEGDGAAAGAGDRLVSILRGDEEVWLSLTEAVMRDPVGAVAGRIFAFRDISADRYVEQMKSEFVSTVSQELRRPLTSIYGFAETLLRRDVLFSEDERRTFVGYIASESERLTLIVDALLNVARLDTGDLQVTLASTDVAPLLDDVVETAQAANTTNDHRLVVDVADEPLAAAADPEKLRLVLSHLVDNAVKYSPNGGTVTVSARRNGEAVEFAVTDEGVGIPSAEQERIFRKFYRAEGGRGPAAPGTGLGLFIVHGLVTAMGGRIWVTSAEGRGSRFAFELPLASPAGDTVLAGAQD